jgi:hypothetical protein
VLRFVRAGLTLPLCDLSAKPALVISTCDGSSLIAMNELCKQTTMLLLAFGIPAAISACQSKQPSADPSPDLRRKLAKTERDLSRSRELVDRYQARYGKLLPAKPKHDFRNLRADLTGKRMRDVTARLGKPAKVFASGASESWDYLDVAYDSASGRTVRRLEVWFKNGTVAYMNASF